MRLAAVTPLLAATLFAAPAGAQTSFDDDADTPRTFSIQERPYRLAHEFELGVGVLPMDAFYVGTVVQFSYTYHLSDFWAWEIVSLDYSLNVDTSLRDELRTDYDLEPADVAPRIQLFGASSLVIKPLFGKLAWRNISILNAETFFLAGIGPHLRVGEATATRGATDEWIFSINLGIGFRFWLSQSFSARFVIRDYLMFVDAVPDHSLLFLLSMTFNYFDRSDPGDGQAGDGQAGDVQNGDGNASDVNARGGAVRAAAGWAW